ncbi:hypothetical protein L484_016766 [Morus notabilis]|uniref:Secreted protein n=1 Tax=Morus notabilis TaxID=981085 RepID=W9RI23_9ROSA|nr:hypothetical protein L484_016766 [Morus notabilis]
MAKLCLGIATILFFVFLAEKKGLSSVVVTRCQAQKLLPATFSRIGYLFYNVSRAFLTNDFTASPSVLGHFSCFKRKDGTPFPGVATTKLVTSMLNVKHCETSTKDQALPLQGLSSRPVKRAGLRVHEH